MKKFLTIFLCVAKREKFGSDPRHEIAKRVKFKPSTDKVSWKMVMPWSKGLLFYDIAVHFCDSVRLASGGNFDIKPFSAGELVPAMQSFDAVSKGSAQAGHDWPGYWKGKNEAFVAFASVPFGLDGEGYNIWLYEKGGAEMMNELYGKFNLVALPGGQCGQEMGLFSNKRATKMEDFKGHARADPRLVHGHHEQPGRLGQPPARRRSLPGAGARRHRCGRVLLTGHQLPHGL
jgi:TRAP-type C4-dicarboxylate transport system substrate-binding protein